MTAQLPLADDVDPPQVDRRRTADRVRLDRETNEAIQWRQRLVELPEVVTQSARIHIEGYRIATRVSTGTCSQ
jgi:hypothetical protein